ncbi:MAG: glycerol-3-phosphate acyltransferase, partial [Ignavibacteriales bacterium]|nr:glycerol-3-phosphate acyltransferase [Ignavibacteriales bacterium]
MLLYLLIFIIAYLMGSFPTAYLLLKYRHGKDITKEGSGNVGALNSFEVTKSRMTGITVLLIDFAKGFLAVFLSRFSGDDLFIAGAIALNAAVLGH